jgi:hypothetical protein
VLMVIEICRLSWAEATLYKTPKINVLKCSFETLVLDEEVGWMLLRALVISSSSIRGCL